MAVLLFTGAVTVRQDWKHNESFLIMSRGREVTDRKHRNNGVTNKTKPSERERGELSLCLWSGMR